VKGGRRGRGWGEERLNRLHLVGWNGLELERAEKA
jgi:hypothetical protein